MVSLFESALWSIFLSRYHPAKTQVSRPPSGISTSAVIISKKSKILPDHKHNVDATTATRVEILALFMREILWCSWKYSVITSWKVIVEVSAANPINKKKTADHNSGIDISLKTNGKVSKAGLAKCGLVGAGLMAVLAAISAFKSSKKEN